MHGFGERSDYDYHRWCSTKVVCCVWFVRVFVPAEYVGLMDGVVDVYCVLEQNEERKKEERRGTFRGFQVKSFCEVYLAEMMSFSKRREEKSGEGVGSMYTNYVLSRPRGYSLAG